MVGAKFILTGPCIQLSDKDLCMWEHYGIIIVELNKLER